MESQRPSYPLSPRERLAERTRSRATIAEKMAEERAPSGKDWKYYDSTLDETKLWSMAASFLPVLPEEYKSRERPLKEYIEETLQGRAGRAIGIELGGPGTHMFHDFTPKFFVKSAGVTLADRRSYWQRDWDAEGNNLLIEGDLQSQEVKKKIDEWRNGEKIDFIIERMGGGLDLLPQDIDHLALEFSSWYELLNEGGVMFVQIPPIVAPLLSSWQEKVKTDSENKIATATSNEGLHNWWVMRLNRYPGAPEKLPLLSPESVTKIFQEQLVAA